MFIFLVFLLASKKDLGKKRTTKRDGDRYGRKPSGNYCWDGVALGAGQLAGSIWVNVGSSKLSGPSRARHGSGAGCDARNDVRGVSHANDSRHGRRVVGPRT